MYAGPGGNRGVFTAWDLKKRGKAWELKEDLPLWSGALATAGDLVFYGTLDGWFKALDARTGELKMAVQDRLRNHWSAGDLSRTGWTTVRRHPFRRGRLGGRDRFWRARQAGPDRREGHGHATTDLPDKTTKGGMLYVFALPRH